MSRHEDVLGNVDEEFRLLERLDRELLSHRGDDLLSCAERVPRAERDTVSCNRSSCHVQYAWIGTHLVC